jgi:hypothetical protein
MIHLLLKPNFYNQHHHNYIKSRFFLRVGDYFLLPLATSLKEKTTKIGHKKRRKKNRPQEQTP